MYLTSSDWFIAFIMVSAVHSFTSAISSPRKRCSSLSMSNALRSGSVVALVTPMDSQNRIDFGQFQDLLLWHKEQGMACTGVDVAEPEN